MFVVTADQVHSRRSPDRVDQAIDTVSRRVGDRLALPPERTAGDEFQLVTKDAGAALDAVLALARDGGWSIGLGIGAAREPLAATVRASTGPAFVAARDAVERARRSPEPRFALTTAPGAPLAGADVEPLVGLLLLVRQRRSAAGWALADLLSTGATQVAAAERLGVSPQAVSQRAIAAGIRIEADAAPAIVRLLREADAASALEASPASADRDAARQPEG